MGNERVIWKYEAYTNRLTMSEDISMPVGAEIVHAEIGLQMTTLWAVVEPFYEVENRTFVIKGTGDVWEEHDGGWLQHIKTQVFPKEGLVLHLLEVCFALPE